jgi:hypothetical protein
VLLTLVALGSFAAATLTWVRAAHPSIVDPFVLGPLAAGLAVLIAAFTLRQS